MNDLTTEQLKDFLRFQGEIEETKERIAKACDGKDAKVVVASLAEMIYDICLYIDDDGFTLSSSGMLGKIASAMQEAVATPDAIQ